MLRCGNLGWGPGQLLITLEFPGVPGWASHERVGMVCVAFYKWKVVGEKGGARAQGGLSSQRAIKGAANIPIFAGEDKQEEH